MSKGLEDVTGVRRDPSAKKKKNRLHPNYTCINNIPMMEVYIYAVNSTIWHKNLSLLLSFTELLELPCGL